MFERQLDFTFEFLENFIWFNIVVDAHSLPHCVTSSAIHIKFHGGRGTLLCRFDLPTYLV